MEEKKIYSKIKAIADDLCKEGQAFTRADLAYELMELGIPGDSSEVSRLVYDAYLFFRKDGNISSAFLSNDHRSTVVSEFEINHLVEEGQVGKALKVAEQELNAASNVDITTIEEVNEVQKAIDKEEERRRRKEAKREELMGSTSYYLMDKIQIIFDKYWLDPIIGFFLPAVGDITTGVLGLPFVYFALVRVKSIPLTLAVIYNILVDCLIGLIPWVGDVIDIFHRAYRKNMQLIIGFVNDDKEVIDEVRRKATLTGVLICAICFLIYLLVRFIIYLAEGTVSLFDSFLGLF